MNILIIRISAIGDVLHTLPAVKLLRHAFPKATFHWVVQKKAHLLLKDQPFVHHTILLPDKPLHPKNWVATYTVIKKLRTIQWDAIIDFQGILKSFVLYGSLAGNKFGFSFKSARSKLIALSTNYHTTVPENSNVIAKNLALASDVITKLIPTYTTSPTIPELQTLFTFTIPSASKEWVETFFSSHLNGIKPIMISPNTTWDSKHWPLTSWEELISKLIAHGYFVVLLGAHMGGQAKELAQIKNDHFFVAPAFDLLQTAYALSFAHVLLAPDTGILHLADALSVPAIGIFCPTSAKKHGPWLTEENKKLVIQISCPHTYQKYHETIDCMEQLTVQAFLQHILTQKPRA
jgi:heptosyltransferase-1